MKHNIAIVIPAYKEHENIPILLTHILKHVPEANVIVVDDSPKHEALQLTQSRLKKGKVTIINRAQKLGRQSAVIFGFKNGLKNKKTDYFFEMDADLSHNPHECQKLLKEIGKADLVIGSRYLPQSKILRWPLRRIVLSRLINVFLNILLGLDLTDYTNGFRLYNRYAVEFLTSIELKETGFIGLSEIAYKLKKKGFVIKEVPTSFTDRTHGKSSANFKEHITSLYGALRIRIS